MNATQWLEWLEKQMVDNNAIEMDFDPGELIAKIFNITTYDSAMSRIFAEQIVEVFEVIRDKNTFQYIQKSHEHYYRFLMVINLKKIIKLLSWGTSIRGCWFDVSIDSVFDPVDGLTRFDNQTYPQITTNEEMGEFITALHLYLDKYPE